MELRPPTHGERAAIRALLADHGLPVEDLETAAIDFILAVESDHVLGVVGLEAFDGTGLLRSLSVRAERRGAGLGAALLQAVEARACARGLRQLVLLTQTAEPFFARHGYATIERASAPASVQTSGEFRSICPASATCMSKSLVR